MLVLSHECDIRRRELTSFGELLRNTTVSRLSILNLLPGSLTTPLNVPRSSPSSDFDGHFKTWRWVVKLNENKEFFLKVIKRV